jgi:hypothetical protein
MNIFNCCLSSTRFAPSTSQHDERQTEATNKISGNRAPISHMQLAQNYTQRQTQPNSLRKAMPYFLITSRDLQAGNVKPQLRKKRSQTAKVKFESRYKSKSYKSVFKMLRPEIRSLNGNIKCDHGVIASLSKTLVITCHNLTELELCLDCRLVAAEDADKYLITVACNLKQLKHLTNLTLILYDLPELLKSTTYLSVFAAIKTLCQLTSLSLVLNRGQQQFLAAIIPNLARLNQLTTLTIGFPTERTELNQIALKLSKLKQLTTLRLDFSFSAVGINALQDLAFNFQQLPQLTQLDLIFGFKTFMMFGLLGKQKQLQWLNLLAYSIQQLPSLALLNLSFGENFSWDEVESLLTPLNIHPTLGQIKLYLDYLDRKELAQMREKFSANLPNFMVTLQEIPANQGWETYVYMLVARRKS